MTNSCPTCGHKIRVNDDTFSYRCEQCSRIVLVPREEVEKVTSLRIIKKKKKKIIEEEPTIIEERYDY